MACSSADNEESAVEEEQDLDIYLSVVDAMNKKERREALGRKRKGKVAAAAAAAAEAAEEAGQGEEAQAEAVAAAAAAAAAGGVKRRKKLCTLISNAAATGDAVTDVCKFLRKKLSTIVQPAVSGDVRASGMTR